jgi:hypothetical protein
LSRRSAGGFALALMVASCAAVEPVRADEPLSLGTPGQWLVGGSAGGSYEKRSWREDFASVQHVDIDHLSFWVAPSAARFVATDIALGAELLAGHDQYDRDDGFEIDELSFGGSALLVWRVAISERTFLLPELALGATRIERSLSFTPGPLSGFGGPGLGFQRSFDEALGGDVSVLHARLSVPFAVAAAPGLYFGIGPYLQARWAASGILALGARDWAAALGLSTVIGFWL